MVRILFVCLGNICRSPMAEFVLKDLAAKRGLSAFVQVGSAATSDWEVGNGVHHGTLQKLHREGVFCPPHRAVLLQKSDYDRYDLLIGMEQENLTDMRRILGGDAAGKLHLLLDFTGHPGDIADPWYTHDFDATYRDVLAGCISLLDTLVREGRLPKGTENG